MTRINCGIHEWELADSHLISEYRELPRILRFAHAQIKFFKDPVRAFPEMDFRLNEGHVRSCARYGGYLAWRHLRLVNEMKARGFKPMRKPITVEDFPEGARHHPSTDWLLAAERIVADRICERICKTMKRTPRWTNREIPLWVLVARPDLSPVGHTA